MAVSSLWLHITSLLLLKSRIGFKTIFSVSKLKLNYIAAVMDSIRKVNTNSN